MAALEARPRFREENWLVLSSTDHGRTPDGGHGGDTPEERTIYFLAWGDAVEPGTIEDGVEIVDVAVTALAHLGFPIESEGDLDGRAVGFRRR